MLRTLLKKDGSILNGEALEAHHLRFLTRHKQFEEIAADLGDEYPPLCILTLS